MQEKLKLIRQHDTENQQEDIEKYESTINCKVCILWPLNPEWNLVVQKHTPSLHVICRNKQTKQERYGLTYKH